jgi:hypothetical protein
MRFRGVAGVRWCDTLLLMWMPVSIQSFVSLWQMQSISQGLFIALFTVYTVIFLSALLCLVIIAQVWSIILLTHNKSLAFMILFKLHDVFLCLFRYRSGTGSFE